MSSCLVSKILPSKGQNTLSEIGSSNNLPVLQGKIHTGKIHSSDVQNEVMMKNIFLKLLADSINNDKFSTMFLSRHSCHRFLHQKT